MQKLHSLRPIYGSSAFLALILGFGVASARAAAPDFVSTRPLQRIDYWQQRQADLTAELKKTQELAAVRLVFLGDSITDFWHLDDNPWFPGLKCGRKTWDESFAGNPPQNRALNLGISGDRMEHILYRLLPEKLGGLGELNAPGLHPEIVVVMVGINNTFAGENPMVDSVFAGIKAVVAAVHECQPKALVLLQSLLPTNEEAKNRDIVRPVNERLVALYASQPFAGYVHYLDLYPSFVDPQGKQLTVYFNDGLHPNQAGYRIWRDRLVPFLAGLRESPRSGSGK
jgi:lysophospholipase L1-like esterase